MWWSRFSLVWTGWFDPLLLLRETFGEWTEVVDIVVWWGLEGGWGGTQGTGGRSGGAVGGIWG
jgi:hypothetical protein